MATNLAYGYLDESPSLHDEAIFFCIGVILTEEQNSKPFANIFKKARKTLKRKKIIVPEVKFSRSIDKVRKQVLEAIIKQGVKIVVLAVDSQNRRIADTPENYGIVVGFAASESLRQYPALALTIDKKFTREADNREMEDTALRVASRQVKKGILSFRPPANSQSEVLIQAADFIAGAMNYKYNLNDPSYWEIIKGSIVSEKKDKWTEMKATTKKE